MKPPFYALWRGDSAWKLSADFREVIAPQMGLGARDLDMIEQFGRAFNDQRTRPSDADVREACSEAVGHAQSLYRTIMDLPWPVKKVLIERMGMVPFMEHLLGDDGAPHGRPAVPHRDPGRPCHPRRD